MASPEYQDSDEDLRLRALAELELEAEAQAGTITSRLDNSIQPPEKNIPDLGARLWDGTKGGLVRPGKDVARDLASGALQAAGAIAVPEAAGLLKGLPYLGRLAPAAIEPGSGILRTILGNLKNSSLSSLGEYFGEEASESLGLKDPSSATDKIIKGLLSTTLGTASGYAGDVASRGTNRLPYNKTASLNNPQVQKAISLAKGEGLLPEEEPLDKIVELANKKAQSLDENIAAEIGAFSGDANQRVATGERLLKSMPHLREMEDLDPSRLFDSNNVGEMVEQAKDKIALADELKSNLISQYNDKVRFSGEDIQDIWSRISPRIKQLRQGISKGISSDIESPQDVIATSLESTFKDFVKRFNSVPVKDAEWAVNELKNINEVRRVLGQDYNVANQAGALRGDVMSPGQLEASREALGIIHKEISQALDKKVGNDLFSNLNKKRGALNDLIAQAELFERGIGKGRAAKSLGNLVPTVTRQGQGSAEFASDVASGGTKNAIIKKLASLLSGQQPPSAGLTKALAVEDSSENALSNIRNLLSLNKNPAEIVPGKQAPLGGRLPSVVLAAKDVGPPLLSALTPSDAEAQTPVAFERSSEALAQQPEAFLNAVAQVSGGNPELLQDVQVALNEPNPIKRDMALMELSNMLPQLFPPSPYKSLWGGRIADPAEQGMYKDDLLTKHRRGEISSTQLAIGMSAMNADGTVLAPSPKVDNKIPLKGGSGPKRYDY